MEGRTEPSKGWDEAGKRVVVLVASTEGLMEIAVSSNYKRGKLCVHYMLYSKLNVECDHNLMLKNEITWYFLCAWRCCSTCYLL